MRLHLVKNCWFRSSVGLEQQPSKLWVLGSNPNGITIIIKARKRKKMVGNRKIILPFFRLST